MVTYRRGEVYLVRLDDFAEGIAGDVCGIGGQSR